MIETVLAVFAVWCLILIVYLNTLYHIQKTKDETVKEIGKTLSDNAKLFKHPSTSNAIYLIGRYYEKNGSVDMQKVSKEVFELGIDRLVNK